MLMFYVLQEVNLVRLLDKKEKAQVANISLIAGQ